jgi:hypothetical protein
MADYYVFKRLKYRLQLDEIATFERSFAPGHGVVKCMGNTRCLRFDIILELGFKRAVIEDWEELQVNWVVSTFYRRNL